MASASPPRILITGGSGFLGSRLAEMIGQRGEAVRLLLRPSSRLDGIDGRYDIVRCELGDDAGLARAMAGVLTVYNCAGLSSDWGSWQQFHAANVEGVANLLRSAQRAGSVQRFVHVSTTDIYGYPEDPCDETYGARDVGLPYNRSKGQGDALALEFGRRSGLPVTVVRPATIFGPRSKDWVVELSKLLISGWVVTLGGGAVPAGLVYVDDVVDAMTSLAASAAAIGEAYNVVDPAVVTWREYFDLMADGLGVRRPRLDLNPALAYGFGRVCEAVYRTLGISSRPLFTRHVVRLLSRDQQYDGSKLRQVVSAFPRVGVATGLARTIAWLNRPIASPARASARQSSSPASRRP